MEVRCLECGNMFSINDHDYRGERESFCSSKCHVGWFNRTKGIELPKEQAPFILNIEEEED